MHITAVCTQLHATQQRIQGLRFAQMSHRVTPDGFSRELKRDVAMYRARAEAELWVLSQFLPTEAPNDPPCLPGAA